MQIKKYLSDFPPEKFYFEIFSKTIAFSITFGLRYINGQSLKEIDFPTRNAVDRFWGDSLLTVGKLKEATIKLSDEVDEEEQRRLSLALSKR